MEFLPIDFKFPTDLTKDQIKSFDKPNNIQKVKLSVGESIWRFVNHKNGNLRSEYWLTPEVMHSVMTEIYFSQIYSKKHKSENIKRNLAIINNWNTSCAFRVKITLKRDVHGYYGPTGRQVGYEQINNEDLNKDIRQTRNRKIEQQTDSRPGGQNQLILPVFKSMSKRDFEEHCTVVYRAMV